MRILVDTNILFSALLSPGSVPAAALHKASEEHEIVLCTRNISELEEVIKKKAPALQSKAEVLLTDLAYELIPAINSSEETIRDAKDQPILNAAILYEVDIILTGDKDFLSLELEHPRCLTASEFLKNY
ncbi:MAG: putative toxin-antitoxin system toxin component, PIN family [Synergistaceae bacterium]|nr:putative toxin-antitoxin system toxin component, PIN family [Synergistaceae bacterium]